MANTQKPEKTIPTEALGLDIANSSTEEIAQSMMKIQQAMAMVPDLGPVTAEVESRVQKINSLLDEISLKVIEFNKTLGANTSTFGITIEGARSYPEMVRKMEQVKAGKPTFDLTDLALLIAKKGD